MKLLLAPKTTEGRYLSVVFILFLLLAAMTFIVWKHPDMAGLEGDSQQQNYWLIGGCCITGCIFIMLVMLLWTARSAGKKEFEALLDVTRGDDNKRKDESENISVSPAVVMCARIRDHLRTRIGIHWRRKVRLLLVTGNEAAIEQLAPGLRQQHWLEGNRTVLIYGGSLASEPDREKYIALRKAAPWPSSGRDCAGDAVVSHPDAADKRERPARAGKNQRTAGLCRPGLVMETVRQ